MEPAVIVVLVLVAVGSVLAVGLAVRALIGRTKRLAAATADVRQRLVPTLQTISAQASIAQQELERLSDTQAAGRSADPVDGPHGADRRPDAQEPRTGPTQR